MHFRLIRKNLERLTGVVERITFHNPENGWTMMKVTPFRDPSRLVAVLIHQVKVFAGATRPRACPNFLLVRPLGIPLETQDLS